MEFLAILLVAGVTFGLCYLVDKGFTKVFRGKDQHRSGKAVRSSKRACALGLILIALGVAAIFTGLQEGWVMLAGGGILIVMGAGLVIRYMTFGIFYDDQGFIHTTFGKRSVTYRYRDIQAQQLFNNQGHILVELYMTDGSTVQLQSQMEGAYAFLDHAFGAWLRQTGRRVEDCPFYDPQNSCWFPPLGEK